MCAVLAGWPIAVSATPSPEHGPTAEGTWWECARCTCTSTKPGTLTPTLATMPSAIVVSASGPWDKQCAAHQQAGAPWPELTSCCFNLVLRGGESRFGKGLSPLFVFRQEADLERMPDLYKRWWCNPPLFSPVVFLPCLRPVEGYPSSPFSLLPPATLNSLQQALEVSADLDMGKVFLGRTGRRARKVLSNLPAMEHVLAHCLQIMNMPFVLRYSRKQ